MLCRVYIGAIYTKGPKLRVNSRNPRINLQAAAGLLVLEDSRLLALPDVKEVHLPGLV